jgi:hypothetical protein
MKGHIVERSPGRWAIILDLYDPATGERRRKWHSFKGTKRQAQTECSRLITQMEEGLYVEPQKLTLAQFLERWLEHIRPNVAPKTYERYWQIATKNLGPLLGTKILSKLQPIDISQAYAPGRCRAADGTGRAVYPRERFTTCTGCSIPH